MNSKVSEVWAVALSSNGQFLAGTTHDGHIKVWDLQNGAEMIRDIETKGSFGMCIDMVYMGLSAPVSLVANVSNHLPSLLMVD